MVVGTTAAAACRRWPKRSAGLADNWLRHIEDIAYKHAGRLDAARSGVARGADLWS